MTTTHSAVRVLAPAKINLFLHVGGKRADGYHDLQSLVAFAETSDALEFEPFDSLSLVLDGPFGHALEGDTDNLVLKAARGLAESDRHNHGAKIKLTKNLPIASGIGGGSADAAATLRGLSALWGIPRAASELAASIGSDVPVCLASRTAWMEGRGERISPLDELPAAHLVLVNPGVAVSTRDVFARLERRSGTTAASRPTSLMTVGDLVRYLLAMRNDLEQPARAMAPAIGDALGAIRSRRALLERMCGSGATCFGLYSNAEDAAAAARDIANSFPQWWVRAARIAPPDIGTPC